MRTNLNVAAAAAVMLLAACGGTDSVSTTSEEGQSTTTQSTVVEPTIVSTTLVEPTRDAAELQAFFEANDWKIVAREGFATEGVDGGVSFFSAGPDLWVAYAGGPPCGPSGGNPIEWSDEGFRFVRSVDPHGGTVDFANVGCNDPGDEDGLVHRFVDQGGPTLAEVSEDGSRVTLRSGGATITLEPTVIPTPPTPDPPPPVTVEVATTTTVG